MVEGSSNPIVKKLLLRLGHDLETDKALAATSVILVDYC